MGRKCSMYRILMMCLIRISGTLLATFMHFVVIRSALGETTDRHINSYLIVIDGCSTCFCTKHLCI